MAKIDLNYVKDVETLFTRLIEKVRDTGLVSSTSFILLELMQRNCSNNFYKKKEENK
jgi:hypothetical protein